MAGGDAVGTRRSRATREVVSERVRCRAGQAAGGAAARGPGSGPLADTPFSASSVHCGVRRGLTRPEHQEAESRLHVPGDCRGRPRGAAPGVGRALLCSPPPPPATQRHLGADRRRPLSGAPWGPGGRWLLIHRVSRLFLRGLWGPPELRSRSPPPARPLVRSARFHVLARGRGCFPEARYPSSSAESPAGLTAPGTWVPGKCMPSE